MKRLRTGIVGAVALLAAAAAGAEQLSVQVREVALRAAPSALAPVTATAKYADRVTVEERRGAWVRVREAGGGAGWVHESAVTRQRIVLRAGEETAAAGASAREVALAGKGFSEEIEQAYRKSNTGIDYAWVDRMEQMEVPAAQMAAFLRDGGVAPRGGGR